MEQVRTRIVPSIPVGATSHKGYKITDEEKQGIARAYHQGKTLSEIQIMFSISDTSCRRVLIEQGINLPKARRPWTTKEALDCERYHKLGWSTVRIAKQLGRTEGSVSGWISDNLKEPAHKMRERNRRLDGTPTPEKKEEAPVKPSLSEQIETAKAKMAEENDFAIEELHRKTITGKLARYTIENDSFDFHIITPVHTKEEFGALVDEMAKVYALM